MEQVAFLDDADLEKIWESFGQGAKLGVRQKLVILTALEISHVGILEFNAKNPCATLGAKSSIVNYYFGGRDGLIAEAALFVHDEWIKAVQGSLSKKPADPVKQLKKIIKADLAFASKWGAMGTLASYPNSSPELRNEYLRQFQSRSQDALEYYLAVLTILIYDARAGNKSLIDFSIGNLPKHKMRTHASAFLAATSLTWSFHGLSMWSAGKHAPSQNIEDSSVTSLTLEYAKKNHINHVIASAIRGS